MATPGIGAFPYSQVPCEKHIFIAVRAGLGTVEEKLEPCVGSTTRRGELVFFSVFRFHNRRP